MSESFDNQDYSPSAEHSEHAGGLSNQQMGGYKAAIHNDKVPQESKEHAQRVLDGEIDPRESNGDKHTNQVLGGYKATLKNPNVGEEAKANAEKVLKEHDAI